MTFLVPTESTRGMMLWIHAPESKFGGWLDANPLVVFQYAGYSPGEWVERAQAVKASSASPCWSGTTEASVSLSTVEDEMFERWSTAPNTDPRCAIPGHRVK